MSEYYRVAQKHKLIRFFKKYVAENIAKPGSTRKLKIELFRKRKVNG